MNDYVLTLSLNCLKSVHIENAAAEKFPQGILGSDASKHKLVCAKLISLFEEAVQSIERNMYITSDNKIDLTSTTTIEERSETAAAITWKKHGSYSLTTVHKSHLCTDHLPCDVHMGAARKLIKRQFPYIHGLRNTLM